MLIDKLKNQLNRTHNLSKTIEELDFTVRTYNILKRQGIATVGDLVELSWKNISGMRRSTRATCEEVERVLKGLGLGLKK